MGVCATAAHPSVHSRPQHLLASRPAFETAIADVVLDRACCFPVRPVTPILTLSRPHLTLSTPPPTGSYSLEFLCLRHVHAPERAPASCVLTHMHSIHSHLFRTHPPQRCQAARASPHDRLCLPHPVPHRPPSRAARCSLRSRACFGRKLRGYCEQCCVFCVFSAAGVIVEHAV